MPVTASDFQFAVDWYKTSTLLFKHSVRFILRRRNLETGDDPEFEYDGEFEYFKFPTKFFITESFQGTGVANPYWPPFTSAGWKVNISLVLEPLSMGIWFIGGPYDGTVWECTFDRVAQDSGSGPAGLPDLRYIDVIFIAPFPREIQAEYHLIVYSTGYWRLAQLAQRAPFRLER